MDITNTLYLRELDGVELAPQDKKAIKIHNHAHDKGLVVIEIDKKRYTVFVSELNKAITNSTNY